MKMRDFMFLSETRRQYYVRFGDLPEGGKSSIGAAPNWVKAMFQKGSREAGVSVYPISWNAEMQRWSIDCNNYASLDELLAQNRPAYMVTGDTIQDEDGGDLYGMDDEPLLTNVKIVQSLPYDKLWIPGGELPEDYLNIGVEPEWLNSKLSEQDRRKAYAKAINGTPQIGHVVILHQDGRVENHGPKKVGRGDLMLMMDGFGLPQGPHTVTYQDEKWQMFWLNDDNRPLNLLACEIAGWPSLRGSVALLKTSDRIDENIDQGRTKFWYHPVDDTLVEFTFDSYHSDHLSELGVPQDEIDKINSSYGDYKYRGNYHNDMYKLAFERGWVRGTFERDGGSMQGIKMRSLQLALKKLSAKRHLEAMRIDHFRIDGRLIVGFGFRGVDAFNHFIKFGTRPPRQA